MSPDLPPTPLAASWHSLCAAVLTSTYRIRAPVYTATADIRYINSAHDKNITWRARKVITKVMLYLAAFHPLLFLP